jgi:hypothetical protein
MAVMMLQRGRALLATLSDADAEAQLRLQIKVPSVQFLQLGGGVQLSGPRR